MYEVLQEHPHPVVVVVGDISRTWEDDKLTMFTVLDLMRGYAPGMVVLHAGKLPFDVYVAWQCADDLGLEVYMAGPQACEDRMALYERSVDLLNHATMVLAFPRQTAESAYPVQTADPTIVAAAVELGIPILSVQRNGAAEWYV